MASDKINAIIEEIKVLSVLEPKEMLLAVQERYGSLFSMMRNG